MTPEQLRQNAAAMIAFADGRPIQWANLNLDDWSDHEDPSWDFNLLRYRPKPEPVTRYWSKPDDVPGPVCWIRRKGVPRGFGALVLGVTNDGVWIPVFEANELLNWRDIRNCDHSTDRINFKPCTVTES